MSALTLRTILGVPLSVTQMDSNLTALNGNSAGLISISTATILTGGTGVSTPNNLGEVIQITAAVAVTTPLANTAANGSLLNFVSNVSGATIVAQGSDTFNVGGTSLSIITLNVGDTLELVSNGTNGWVVQSGSVMLPYSAQANTLVNGLQVISVAGGTNVTLTTAQSTAQIMKFTGALTANINVIVPANGKTFTVLNNTTGAFTLTIKTTSGTGITVTQGMTQELICEGVNIIIASNDLIGAGIASIASMQTAVNGYSSISVAGGTNVTLTSVQASYPILNFTGALTANITVAIPAASKDFIAVNNTTGAFTLTVIATGGTGVTIIQGQSVALVCDGTNVFQSTTPTGNTQIPYSNRAQLRSTEGPITVTASVESLGVFTWKSGFNDIDDDETCFLSATGTWLLVAADPDLAWAYTYPELSDLQNHFLYGTYNHAIASLAPQTYITVNTPLANAGVGDTVYLTPSGVCYATVEAYVSAPNVITISFGNTGASAVTLTSGLWTILVIKKDATWV